MSIAIVETSFDQLIRNIQAPPTRSRSASLQSYDGAQQGQNIASSKQDISQTEFRRPSNTGSQGSSSTASAANGNKQSSWRTRSRSGSVASSTSSGKLAYTGILRHAVQRPGNSITSSTKEETSERPFPMARRVTGPQNRAGCILSSQSEVRPHVQGLTPTGLPVWWCQYDNMVVFDGMLKDGNTGDWIPMTRSSKGLPIANAHGEEESVLLDLQCEHCKIVLGLKQWRYATKVCERSVCAGCKVRCRQEYFRMMKQGHSFNHFEKVTQKDKSQAPILERMSSAEITNSVLAPLLETIAKEEPSVIQAVSSQPATAPSQAVETVLPATATQVPVVEEQPTEKAVVSENTTPTKASQEPRANDAGKEASNIQEVSLQEAVTNEPATEKPALEVDTTTVQELTVGSPTSTKSRNAPSISGLYFKDNVEEQHVPTEQAATEETAAGIAVELSPTHSAEDIGLAITIDGSQAASPDRRSLTLPESEHRDSVSGLTITLPEDCHQDASSAAQNDLQAESPQSEHPQTPTFEFSEPGPIIEDILSPKFPENYDGEEPFDISLMMRNLDTDEVSSMPVQP